MRYGNEFRYPRGRFRTEPWDSHPRVWRSRPGFRYASDYRFAPRDRYDRGFRTGYPENAPPRRAPEYQDPYPYGMWDIQRWSRPFEHPVPGSDLGYSLGYGVGRGAYIYK